MSNLNKKRYLGKISATKQPSSDSNKDIFDISLEDLTKRVFWVAIIAVILYFILLLYVFIGTSVLLSRIEAIDKINGLETKLIENNKKLDEIINYNKPIMA